MMNIADINLKLDESSEPFEPGSDHQLNFSNIGLDIDHMDNRNKRLRLEQNQILIVLDIIISLEISRMSNKWNC